MNDSHLVISAVIVVAVAAAASLLLWAASFLRYEIAPPCLKITWLGLPLRRIRLDDIRSVSTKPVFFAEQWYNTLRASDRLLVLRRHTGRCKCLAITPRHRFMFRAELFHARDGTSPLPPGAATNSADTLHFDKPKHGPEGSSPSKPAKNAA